MKCLVCGAEAVEEETQWRCPSCNWSLLKEEDEDDDENLTKYGDMNY